MRRQRTPRSQPRHRSSGSVPLPRGGDGYGGQQESASQAAKRRAAAQAAGARVGEVQGQLERPQRRQPRTEREAERKGLTDRWVSRIRAAAPPAAGLDALVPPRGNTQADTAEGSLMCHNVRGGGIPVDCISSVSHQRVDRGRCRRALRGVPRPVLRSARVPESSRRW